MESVKSAIQTSLNAFASGDLTKNALHLFETLGYVTDRRAPLQKPTKEQFKEVFVQPSVRFNEVKAQIDNWSYVDLL